MRIGDTLRITAEVLPLEASNRTVRWTSSNTNVCIVDSNGLVQAVGTGSCTILCESLDGKASAMCNIYVKQPVTQVDFKYNRYYSKKRSGILAECNLSSGKCG